MKTFKNLGVLVLAAGAFTAPAIAQDLRSVSGKVVACQTIEDSSERLACFEAAAAELSLALDAPAVLATPEQPSVSQPVATAEAPAPVQMAAAETAPEASAETEQTGPTFPRRSLLPSWVPTVNLRLGGGDAAEEPDFFETEVTRIQRNKIGRHFFTTTDGQVWRQIRIDAIRAPDALPAKATIRQTLSGSIRLEIEDNGRSYPVTRIE